MKRVETQLSSKRFFKSVILLSFKKFEYDIIIYIVINIKNMKKKIIESSRVFFTAKESGLKYLRSASLFQVQLIIACRIQFNFFTRNIILPCFVNHITQVSIRLKTNRCISSRIKSCLISKILIYIYKITLMHFYYILKHFFLSY